MIILFVDIFKDDFLFSQPHDLSMEDIDEDDLQEDNINKEIENNAVEVNTGESMAVEISEKMVEGDENESNKEEIELKEDDKVNAPSIDAVDTALTVETVKSTNVADKVDIVVDTADKQEKVVEEAVDELVAKADTTEKESDGSLLIIGARRSRRRLSPRSAKSTPKRGSQVTRATVDNVSDADSNNTKAVVQSPSTRSRASKSVKSQRGAAKAVLAHIDQMLAGLSSAAPTTKEIVKDKQVTPEARTTRKSSEVSVNKGTPSRQASATPTRGQSARKASATPTRSSARKTIVTPTRASARKASATPTRVSARKASATPTREDSVSPARSSTRKASVTPTRSSARKASATPTRVSARKASATPTRVSTRKASATPTRPSSATPSKTKDEPKSAKINIKKQLAKTPDIEDASKSTTTPIRKSTRKLSIVLSPSSALLRPSSARNITRRSTIAGGVPILTPNTPSRKSKRLDSVTPNIAEEVGTPTRRSSRASSGMFTFLFIY